MAKKSTKTVKKSAGFNWKEFSLFMAVFAVVGLFTLWVSFAAPVMGACSISPNPVVLDQTWNVNAQGLPTKGSVNQILTWPNGGQVTGPVTVASDGTYATTGSSKMTTGFGPSELTGTYKYQFVGKVRWPAGTYNQTFATCSVVVN